MATAFDQFRTVIQGHEFYNDPVTKQALCRNPEHPAWDPHCWKAQATGFFLETNPDFRAGASKDDRVQDIVSAMDSGSMVTTYILLAEGMDTEGNRAIYTATTDNIAVWDELKLLEWAKQVVVAKMQGR